MYLEAFQLHTLVLTNNRLHTWMRNFSFHTPDVVHSFSKLVPDAAILWTEHMLHDNQVGELRFVSTLFVCLFPSRARGFTCHRSRTDTGPLDYGS